MKKFKSLLDKFTSSINVMVVVFAVIMMILGVLQIFFRYVVKSSLSWSEECMRYMHVWITTIGGSLCYYEGMFTTINDFYDAIRKKSTIGGKILLVLQYLLAVVFYAVLLYFGTRHCINSWVKISSTTRISLGVIYLCLPLSGFFGLCFSAGKFPEIWRKLTGKEEV